MYVSDAYNFNVTTDSYSTFNIGSSFTVAATQVTIGSSSSDVRLHTTNGANVHLDPDGEVEINSTSVSTGAENLL